MSKILELYKDLAENKQRFIEEAFEGDSYSKALPKLTIFDIGAYMGEFAFYSLNWADKIYCFEPDPFPFEKLEERVKRFELADKVKIYPIALGDSEGERVFRASHDGGSQLLSKAEKPNNETITVKTKSLAQFMKEEGIEHIDILKIDIEGGEDELFRSEDFKEVAGKIDIIIGEHLAGVSELLQSLGFKMIEEVYQSNTVYKR